MKQKSKKVLEFNKIINQVYHLAETSLGKDKVKEMDISTNIDSVRMMQKETSEAVSIIIEKGRPPLGGIYDLKEYIKLAYIGGTLSIKALLNSADTLRATRLIKNYLLADNKDERDYHILETLAEKLTSYKKIEESIFNAIISEEEISDNASSLLRKIRRDIQNKNSSIRSKLNSIVNSSQTKKYLQDSIVTIRNDRFVVPVRQEYRNMIKGLIHDQSSSGATLFIEPMQIVEMNNQLSQLKLDEKKEIERILSELSSMIAEVKEDILNNQDVLKELDYIFAKGKFSLNVDGIEPLINNEGYIRIKKGRHPLISKDDVVPIDIWLGKDFTTLIITGPNTGGKTVTLKTLGLFTLMGMAGLHLPAEYGTEISVFDGVYADIGDEQSIEQSLSTFSSHMTNIVKIMKEVNENSFVLFDELGAGTDPVEGAALAMAVLNTLRERKIITAATTHYSELKLYALTTDGVNNGSVEFNVETLSPTYKVLIGVPGKSNAFEISTKLGLNANIINKARNLLEREEIKFEDALAQIEKDRLLIEKNKAEIDKIKKESKETYNKYITKEKQANERKEKIIYNANIEAKKILDEAKKEANEIIKELKKHNFEMDKEKSRNVNHLRQKINDKIKEIDNQLYYDGNELEINNINEELKKGDQVFINTVNQKGYIISEPDDSDNLMVQIGLMKLKVNRKNVVKIVSEDIINQKVKNEKMTKLKSKVVKQSIDVRGLNLEEAFLEIDKYLDDAYISGLSEVQIIHGKGTGVLREGISQFLKSHKQVKEYRIGSFKEGGNGVTIVKFK